MQKNVDLVNNWQKVEVGTTVWFVVPNIKLGSQRTILWYDDSHALITAPGMNYSNYELVKKSNIYVPGDEVLVNPCAPVRQDLEEVKKFFKIEDGPKWFQDKGFGKVGEEWRNFLVLRTLDDRLIVWLDGEKLEIMM